MSAPSLPVDPVALVPHVRDIDAGYPARIAGVPIPANAPSYTLQVFKDDSWGSTELFASTESQPGLPIFELSAQDTASLGTLLAASTPAAFDRTTAATGWYRITGVGTDPNTSDMVALPSAHGPLVVRLDPGLTRRPAAQYTPPNTGCGCGGRTLDALGCGCCGASSGTPCDHAPVPDPNACNVITQRARFKARWRGTYTELDPPDGLGPYVRWDVVEAGQRQFVYVCPPPTTP